MGPNEFSLSCDCVVGAPPGQKTVFEFRRPAPRQASERNEIMERKVMDEFDRADEAVREIIEAVVARHRTACFLT